MMKLFVYLLLFIIPFCVYSQNYKGEIGKHSVCLKIKRLNDEDIESSYFYESQLKNIKLEGEMITDGYRLYLQYSSPDEKKELFILKSVDNKLVGEWFNNGISLPVELTEIKVDLESYKREKLDLKRGEIQKFGDFEIVWFKEKYTQLELFRLGNGFKDKQRRFLNEKLDSIHEENSMSFLECGDYYSQYSPKFITDSIISFTENFDIYCGGAHPSHGMDHFNFDIKNNKEIKNLKELYPKLDFVKFLKNKYKIDPDLNTECKYFNSKNRNVWKYSQFHLTNEGIIIEPSYPHAMAPCRERFEIKYSEIRR